MPTHRAQARLLEPDFSLDAELIRAILRSARPLGHHEGAARLSSASVSPSEGLNVRVRPGDRVRAGEMLLFD
jgi:hypothetical protein